MMSDLKPHAVYFFTLADTLIPAWREMPSFSEVCTLDDVARCLEWRPDVAADFQRAVANHRSGSGRDAILALATDDAPAFSALGLIVVSAYHMAARVRELIGYPGQLSIPLRPGEAEADLHGDLLGPVIARGRRYVATPAG